MRVSVRTALTVAAGFVAMIAPGTASAEPRWLPPSLNVLPGQAAKVDVDASGIVYAAWQATGDGPLVGTVRIPGGRRSPSGWGPLENISGAYSGAVDLAVSDAGRATAVWRTCCHFDTPEGIRVADREVGATGWSAATTLSPEGGSAGAPKITVNAAGDVVIVWQRQLDGATVISEATRASGVDIWSVADDISFARVPDGPGNASSPDVAIDAQGRTTAAWVYDNGTRHIRTDTGSGLKPITISGAGAASPQVVSRPDRSAVVTWERDTGTQMMIEAAVRDPISNVWQAPKTIGPGSSPQIATDAAGNVTVVFASASGVAAADLPAGVDIWGAPQTLPDSSGGQTPRLASNAAGDLAVVWDNKASMRRRQEGTWRTQSIAGRTPAYRPRVAVDQEGNAAAVWDYADVPGGGAQIVAGTGFDAAGPRLQSLTIPALTTLGVSADFVTNPLDTWSSSGTVTWDLGDGTGATGPQTQHAYASAGEFTVIVTATDALGNATRASRTVSVAPAIVPIVEDPGPLPTVDPDPDRDGILGGADACPKENARARDANANGCLDYGVLTPDPLLNSAYYFGRPRIVRDGRYVPRGIRVRSLTVAGLPRGATIHISCTRNACPAHAVHVGSRARTPIPRLKGRRLPKGAKVIISATMRSYLGGRRTYAVGSQLSKSGPSCLAPGSTTRRVICTATER
jgi:hypothetical protein